MDEFKAQAYLKFIDRKKVIPYPGCDNGGSINYGFKVLKNCPDEAKLITEAQDNEHLKQALIDINDQSTSFFTIGCEKVFKKNDYGFFASGFIEIAFNYKEMVAQPDNYFRLFMHFTKELNAKSLIGPIRYEWEIEPAYFSNVNQDGYSVAVWILCGLYTDIQQAESSWGEAIVFLTDFLKSTQTFNLTKIY